MERINMAIKESALSSGADLVGIAGLAPFSSRIDSLPGNLLEPYSYAVSMAVALDSGTLAGITDRPAPGYSSHYREDALRLDACNSRTLENHAIKDIGARICGVCIRACPWTPGP